MLSRLKCVAVAIFLLGTAAGADAPDPRLQGYRTPPGWKLEVAATEPLVVNPVTMTWGPDGRLYVIEWKEGRGPNDHIKALTDEDGDGAFDKADIYMDGLDLPAGLLFWDGWTYVTLDHDVVRMKDQDGDGKFETREAIVTGFGNDDSHHRVSGMTLGPDGWLYLTTGDSDCRARGSDGSTATILRSGGVVRCKPDGSRLEVVAFGMRNPWGNVAFDDEFRMFHTDNDNEGAQGFTGCRLLHVVEGGDYGWRLRQGARCCQPDYERATWNGGRPGRLGWIAETGRGAPAGLCILNSTAFPPSMRNLLVYPDVFRKLVRAYKLKPKGASFEVDAEFELLAHDDGLFRPNDAEVGPDGALYILDWRTDSGGAGALSGNGKTGRIYRMSWGGTPDQPARPTLPRDRFAKLIEGDEDELIGALSSEDLGLRTVASRELMRRGLSDFRRLGILLFRRDTPLQAARHALAILHTQPIDPEELKPLRFSTLMDRDVSLRRLGLELAGRFGTQDDAQGADMLLGGRLEEDPVYRRALVAALGRFTGLRRSRPGENVDYGGLMGRYFREIGLTRDGKESNLTPDERDRVNKLVVRGITTDMIAQALLDLYTEAPADDPFLRDGIARGLERLGPAGIATLTNAIATEGPKRTAAALSVLQSWRGEEALGTIIDMATGPEPIPAETRAGLYRSLRELGEAVTPEPIVAWLKDAPGGPPAARVEAIRVLTAMGRRAALAAGPALPGLLADGNADVRRAALALAAGVLSAEAKASLVELARNADRPADERRLAVAALRGYEDKALAPTLDGLFGTSTDGAFQAELLRTLSSLDFPAAAKRAEALLGSTDEALRHEAIGLLGQKPETALTVANLYNAGKLPRQDLGRVIEAVRPHGSAELRDAMQTLLKNTLLAAPTGAEAARLREFVNRRGNPARGKEIFLDAKKGNCATCHRLEGVGGSVGPDLTRVWETLSFDKRVESILEPSKEIKEGFATFKLATKDGKVYTGLLLSDTAEGVALRDAQGQEVKVPAAEIDQKATDPVSLMPAGVVGHLSFEELADLLSFLGDRKAQESLKK